MTNYLDFPILLCLFHLDSFLQNTIICYLSCYKSLLVTSIHRVSRYLQQMYESSILKGPLIFLKPAQNYHEYVYFLTFENPLFVYQCLKGFPHIVSQSLTSGRWNLLLICDRPLDFSVLKGFKQCLLKGVKGTTYLSKVTTLDGDESIKKMQSMIQSPEEKTSLFEEIPMLPWKPKEWTLYDRLKYNVRIEKKNILKQSKIRYELSYKWISELSQFASIQPAIYPYGTENYLFFDFLFRSEHHKQLTDILGQLPSTSLFFSVGEYLFARLSVLDQLERKLLLPIILQLQKKGFLLISTRQQSFQLLSLDWILLLLFEWNSSNLAYALNFVHKFFSVWDRRK